MEQALNIEPLIGPKKKLVDVNEDVARPLERFPGKAWWVVFGAALACLLVGVGLVTYQFKMGLGVLGLNHPVG